MSSVAIVLDKYSCSPAIWFAYKKHIDWISKSHKVTVFVPVFTDVSLGFCVEGESYITSRYSGFLDLSAKLLMFDGNKVYLPHVRIAVMLSFLKLWKKSIYVWFQGALPEESMMRNQSIIRYKILSIIERVAFSVIDGAVFVSRAMYAHYKNKYGVHCKNYFVLPCFSDLTAQLEVERVDDSYVYVGGGAPWQRVDLVIKAFKEILKKTPESRLWLVSNDRDGMNEVMYEGFGNTHPSQIKIMSISERSDMEVFLSSIRYGFLFRDQSVVNKVSSPIKLGEYMSCGVVPIMSDGVGDYSEYIRNQGAGFVVDGNELDGISEMVSAGAIAPKYVIDTYNQLKARFTPEEYFKSFLNY